MMQTASSKSNTINFLWKFLERIGSQVVSFVVSIILARLLLPEDYGVIAVVTIFITIADVFVNVGLGAALIQKKDVDELDYSSAFVCNLGLAVILYCIIFACSPLIAEWFEIPSLNSITKVLGLQVILASILSIQNSYVSKQRLFSWNTNGVLGVGRLGPGYATIITELCKCNLPCFGIKMVS